MFSKLMQTFESLLGMVVILVMLPCLLGAVVRAVGTFDLLVVLAILSVVGFLRHQNRAPSAGRRRTASERTPLLPKGDD